MNKLRNLGELEQRLMNHIWSKGPVTAEDCRAALASRHPLKDSTVRTILRRLEEKGYLTHDVEGRTFVYRATAHRRHVAARAVQSIVDRFCSGSVEQLLVGMVESDVLDHRELQQLARRIAEHKEKKS